MKQTILTVALAVAMSFGIQSFAQSTQTEGVKTEQSSEKDKKECKKADKQCKKADKKGKKDGKKGQRGEGRRFEGDKNRPNPAFRGIELTADQQGKIDKLNEKLDKDFESAREKTKAECDKAREAYDKEVGKVLTPDQLKVYEANKAEMKERRGREPRVDGFAPGMRPEKCRKADCPKKAECQKADCPKKTECQKVDCPKKAESAEKN